jgi:chromosome partitioning protein
MSICISAGLHRCIFAIDHRGESVHNNNCAVVQLCTIADLGNPMDDMKIVAVSVNKGGVGKTTVAKSLATSAVAAGLNVLVLDMDTQQNSTKWGRRRAELQKLPLPIVRFTTEGDLEDEVKKARAAGCDLVVIDTPPGRSSEAPAAIEVADLVIIPCVAEDVDSFDGIPKTARVARTIGKTAVGLLNCATPGSRLQEETAKAVMKLVGIPLAPVILHRYTVHRDANPKGLTGAELEPDSRAALEIKALWEWVWAQLQNSTSAIVHKKVAT